MKRIRAVRPESPSRRRGGCGIIAPMSQTPRPAVYLDRDGTLIEERSYLTRPEQVRLLPGSADAVSRLQTAGFACVVVTNQSGVGRGLMTEADLALVHDELRRQLRE